MNVVMFLFVLSHLHKMGSAWFIAGLSVGVVMILAGAVVLVLAFATKMFYTNTEKVAGDSLTDGSSLLAQAAVAWDETGIVLDSTGKFVKWSSTASFRDTSAGASYTYDLLPSATTGLITKVTSNTGISGLAMNGSCYLLGQGNATKTWASVPTYASDNTVIFAFSCPTTRTTANPSGMAFGNYDSPWIIRAGQMYQTYIDTATTSVNSIYPLGNYFNSSPITGIKSYTPLSSTTTVTSNVSAYSYTFFTNQYATFFNGTNVPFTVPVPQVIPQTSFPAINIGRMIYGGVNSNCVGTVHAAYIFKRVLPESELSLISAYLQNKYFAPALKYPVSIKANVGSPLVSTVSNTLVSNAAPIVSYSITPSLPPGLTFNTTTGDISGTPTVESPDLTYTITATNAVTSATTNISIQTIQVTATVNKIGVSPPNISLSTHFIASNLGDTVTSPVPTNTGGVIDRYTIQPKLVDPDLTFDPTTGVVSGLAKKAQSVLYTITASNDGGSSSTTLKLQVGTTFTYSGSIRCKVDQVIEPIVPVITSADGTTPPITSLKCAGDLHGLSFDDSTGIISGKPSSSGVGYLDITAIIASVPLECKVSVSIVAAKEFKDKNMILGSVGAAIGAGALLAGTCAYFQYAH